jgi:hypothetical protein
MTKFSVEQLTLLIGVITIIIGVYDSRKSHKEAIKAQYLQIILSISESFRNKWEAEWSNILDELNVSYKERLTDTIPEKHRKSIRYMLNWIDWLGAMKSSGALEELEILTSSIGIPMAAIVNAGYKILLADCKENGSSYWKNLFVVAKHLNIDWAIELENEYA